MEENSGRESEGFWTIIAKIAEGRKNNFFGVRDVIIMGCILIVGEFFYFLVLPSWISSWIGRLVVLVPVCVVVGLAGWIIACF